MNQSDNQSIIIEGVSEVALDGLLDDLSVQNADAIKGGPYVGSSNGYMQWLAADDDNG
ncbi:MAG: hypothetical protein ACKVZH_29550 [Blastocatellia bacterium]